MRRSSEADDWGAPQDAMLQRHNALRCGEWVSLRRFTKYLCCSKKGNRGSNGCSFRMIVSRWNNLLSTNAGARIL